MQIGTNSCQRKRLRLTHSFKGTGAASIPQQQEKAKALAKKNVIYGSLSVEARRFFEPARLMSDQDPAIRAWARASAADIRAQHNAAMAPPETASDGLSWRSKGPSLTPEQQKKIRLAKNKLGTDAARLKKALGKAEALDARQAPPADGSMLHRNVSLLNKW